LSIGKSLKPNKTNRLLQKCEQEFQVTVSDAIVGGPFLPEPANSTGAKISGANFEGAEYDGDTLFPEGFDPKKHKMISKS
jgi:hypothetical protein